MISKVRHKQTGVEYALKTIQLNKISSNLAKEMRNEIEILKRLDHPNIIRESLLQIYSRYNSLFPPSKSRDMLETTNMYRTYPISTVCIGDEMMRWCDTCGRAS